MKWLYGIKPHEYDTVWNIASQRTAEIAAAKDHGREGATEFSPISRFEPAFP